MGNQWFSKDTTGFVDAEQICKDRGYSGIINEYGGNSGTNCKYSNTKDGKNPSFNTFGQTVSWKCEN